jgi:REP element-mobilizing transposase RayT
MTDRPFNTDDPIAYFITWTSYGTWLPGDERGWHQWGESEVRPPNELFVQMAAAAMKETEFTLAPEDREVVEQTVARHCQVRGWTLHTVRARSNHVHVVVTAPGYHPKTVRDQFKAWCTRHLKPKHPVRERFWTEGGSCRWINHEDDLASAIAYVNDAQDRKGLDLQARGASK